MQCESPSPPFRRGCLKPRFWTAWRLARLGRQSVDASTLGCGRRDRPTGTVTFLFTDIEGSTRLWEIYPDAMCRALARHDALVRDGIQAAHGYVFKAAGDAFYAAFAVAHHAVAAALHIQTALTAEPWPEHAPLKVRMALHTGPAEARGGDYFGRSLNKAARILAAAHGGQTLLSCATYELCRDALPDDVTVRDLGLHRLRDIARPEPVYQLACAGLRSDFPPLGSIACLAAWPGRFGCDASASPVPARDPGWTTDRPTI